VHITVFYFTAGAWRWFDESNVLTCCTTHDHVQLRGITLAEVHCLAQCNGAASEIKYADHISEEEFRRDIISCCAEKGSAHENRDDMKYLVVSYSRKQLNQTGVGHFSPIGGYHPKSDMVHIIIIIIVIIIIILLFLFVYLLFLNSFFYSTIF
jgi:glutathione gamma-glutamylcysteinyltransferase